MKLPWKEEMTTIKGDETPVLNTPNPAGFNTNTTGYRHSGPCMPGCDCEYARWYHPSPVIQLIQQGWECPRCNAVMAPFVHCCVNCTGEKK